MKANIHPQYFDAQVTCACGNTFTIGSTQPKINVELCSKCHPFYTGEQRFVDSASRIDRFKKHQEKANQIKVTLKEKEEKKREEKNAPKTLAEMLAALK